MRGLRSADLTNVLQYTLHQSAGPRSCRRDVRIATEKNLLILQSSGSPKQSFPLFCSSLPQSDGNSSSLPEDRSDWIELGPNKKLLTGLKGQDPVPVSLSLPILCILRHPNKGRGSGK